MRSMTDSAASLMKAQIIYESGEIGVIERMLSVQEA